MKTLRLYACTSVIGLIACATAANAQADVAPTDQRAIEPALGDIVVTARRVEEKLQDVPISITTFNQQQLSDRHVTDAADLVVYTPGLSGISVLGRDNAQYAIRGFNQETSTSASVAVYFADVGAPRGGGTQPAGGGAGPGAFFDLQNVQVLKGPQGTLFGRNTTGGAILLVPQKPTGRFEGYLEGLYGSYDWKGLQGVINLPLSDIARFRLGVDYQKRDGFTKSVDRGPDVDDRNYIAVRASLDVDLTPNLENYTIVTYLRSRNNNSSNIITVCNPNLGLVAYLVCGTPTSTFQRQQQLGPRRFISDLDDPIGLTKQAGIINTTTWTASDTLTIKNIVSYTELATRFRSDLYGTDIVLPPTIPITFPTGTVMAPTGAYAGQAVGFIDLLTAPAGQRTNDQSTFTEELQFQGNLFDGRLTWQAGVYFEKSRPLSQTAAFIPVLLNCTDARKLQCSDPLGAVFSNFYSAALGFPLSIQVGGLTQRLQKTSFQDIGAYSQATFALTDQIKLTGGIRYTRDRTASTSYVTLYKFPQPNVPVLECGQPAVTTLVNGCEQKFKTVSSAPTWLAGIDYKPADDILVYAKYSRGYRQGSVAPGSAPGFETFGPEKVDTYEAGAKTQFNFGGVKGIFNIAGFYNNFTDQQISALFAFAQTAIAPASGIVNAGKSRIYGFEVETTIVPFSGFSLNGSYTYLNTKLLALDLPTAPAPVPPATQPAFSVISTAEPGTPLSFSPRHKFSVTGSYILPLDDAIGKISVGATYSYTSRQFQVASSPVGMIPSYGLLNLNLNWRGIGGTSIDGSFFVTNLTNKLYVLQPGALFASSGFDVVRYGEPRLIGGRLRYNF